jgi:long-chain acyl-CoA synthetase
VGGTAGYLRIRSGGTTGPAKTIRRTHHSWIASFEVNRAHLGLGAADVYGILGRPVHSLALYAIVEAAHVGADIVDLAGLRPVHQVAGLVERVATVLYATPTQLRLLKSVGRQLPTLRHVLCGGGHMGQDLRHEVQRIAPNATVTEFYGAAETSFIAWSDGSWPEGSVGQAYPGVEICIDPPGADLGTIWVKSPYLFEGYAEGQSPDTQWQDGFVTVGEVGHLAEDGSLSIAGRKNRMVTIADQNVFPEDIELFFLALQGVTHAVVLPRSDQDRGTVLVALIDALPENMTVDDLLRAGRKRFGALAAPRRIFVAEDFPVTASGKPDLLRATHLIEAQE